MNIDDVIRKMEESYRIAKVSEKIENKCFWLGIPFVIGYKLSNLFINLKRSIFPIKYRQSGEYHLGWDI